MRVYNLNSGIFLGNIQHILINVEHKDEDIHNMIKHLKNPIIIINLSTTIYDKSYNTKLLPLAVNDENYEIIKK